MIKIIFGTTASLSLFAVVALNTYVPPAKSGVAIGSNKTDIKDRSSKSQLLADSSTDPNLNDGRATDSLFFLDVGICGYYQPTLNRAGIVSYQGLQFNNAGSFSEGLASVPINEKCGYIDTTGKLVIPAKFDSASNFYQGLALIKTNGKWGYIDRTGNIAIAPQFDRASSFYDGLAIVQSKGKQGFIDRTGKPVIPLKFHSVSLFQDGLALVKFNGKYGYIDLTGKFVIPPQFAVADDFHEGVARIDGGSNGVYFIDRAGRRITKPGQLSSAFAAQDGLIGVSKTDRPDGKELWGFIDLSGKQIIPFKFDGMDSFQEGLAVVVVNDKYGYIYRSHG
jgi:WG containing repeat